MGFPDDRGNYCSWRSFTDPLPGVGWYLHAKHHISPGDQRTAAALCPPELPALPVQLFNRSTWAHTLPVRKRINNSVSICFSTTGTGPAMTATLSREQNHYCSVSVLAPGSNSAAFAGMSDHQTFVPQPLKGAVQSGASTKLEQLVRKKWHQDFPKRFQHLKTFTVFSALVATCGFGTWQHPQISELQR